MPPTSSAPPLGRLGPLPLDPARGTPALLVVTRDPVLRNEVARLAAGAGVEPEVVGELAAVLRRWQAAAVVLVGADLAAELVQLGLPRRAGVHLVAWGGVGDHLFRAAVALAAEDVSELPQAAGWLGELLTDLDDGRVAPGRLVGVVGGSGGAGATTFACALAQRAALTGPALVVDADPLGPGLDRVFGLEERAGVRWPELGRTTGRLSSRALREAVPRRGGLGVLTWAAGPPGALQPFAVREVLSAAARGHRVVVVDLPRTGEVAAEVRERCDCVLLVVRPTVAGLAAAARWSARVEDPTRLRVVVRGIGAPDADVARALRLPVVASMPDQRGLAEALDVGAGPVRSWRGPLGRAGREVLERLVLLGTA